MKMVIAENDRLHERGEGGRPSRGFDSPTRFGSDRSPISQSSSDVLLQRTLEEQRNELDALRRERNMQKTSEAEFERMSAVLEERCQ